MAYIKTVSDLPKWFNIENYQIEKENIKASKLLEQIIYRKALFDILTNPNFKIPMDIQVKDRDNYSIMNTYSNGFSSIPYLDWDELICMKNQKCKLNPEGLEKTERIINHAFSKIHTNPLFKNPWGILQLDYEFSWVYCVRVILCEYENYGEINPIKDLTVYELGEKFTMLPPGVAQCLKSEFKGVHEANYLKDVREHLKALSMEAALDDFEEEEDETLDGINCDYIDSLSKNAYEDIEIFYSKSFLSVETDNTHKNPYEIKPFISVDLSCSDSVIKEQFDKWLQHQRKNINKVVLEENLGCDYYSVKRMGESLLYKVYSYQLLAYIDLFLWGIFTGNKIKQSVFTHALFPQGAYDGEFIRKTIKPLIDKLLNPQSREISELFALKNLEDFSI